MEEIKKNDMTYFEETLEGAYLSARYGAMGADAAVKYLKARAFDLITEYAIVYGIGEVANMVWNALDNVKMTYNINE